MTPTTALRAHLIVSLLVAVLAASLALAASAEAALMAASPQNGATVTRGSAVTLTAQLVGATSYDMITFKVSRSPAVGTDGALSGDVSSDLSSGTYGTDNFSSYSYKAVEKVGTVYWQATRNVCTTSTTTYQTTCTVETSAVPTGPAAPRSDPGRPSRQRAVHRPPEQPGRHVHRPERAVPQPQGRLLRSSRTGADGVLNDAPVLSEWPLEVSGTYGASLPSAFLEPGKVYWQVFSDSCADDPADCKLAAPVRSLTILPKPVSLSLTGSSPQRVNRKPLNVKAKCSIACTLKLKATASVKTRRGRAGQSAFDFTRSLTLPAGESVRAGRVFTGAKLRALTRLVAGHPKGVRFSLTATATDEFQRTDAVKRAFTVLPKPKPRPKSSGGGGSPKPKSERSIVMAVAEAELDRRYVGAYVDSCRKLDPGYWRCTYGGYNSTLGSLDGDIYVRRHTYGWDATVI